MASPLDETARANNIHCWWRSGVRQALQGQPGIREISALQFFAVAVDSNPVVRFKCVSLGEPSNVRTGQQKDLSRQEYDDDLMEALTLEGIPSPPTTLTCGYSLNLAAELTSIEIRCDYRRRALWRWQLWGDTSEGEITELIPLPGTSEPQPARVSSKKTGRTSESAEQLTSNG